MVACIVVVLLLLKQGNRDKNADSSAYQGGGSVEPSSKAKNRGSLANLARRHSVNGNNDEMGEGGTNTGHYYPPQQSMSPMVGQGNAQVRSTVQNPVFQNIPEVQPDKPQPFDSSSAEWPNRVKRAKNILGAGLAANDPRRLEAIAVLEEEASRLEAELLASSSESESSSSDSDYAGNLPPPGGHRSPAGRYYDIQPGRPALDQETEELPDTRWTENGKPARPSVSYPNRSASSRRREDADQDAAATRIQARFKGHQVRKAQKQENAAATKIQAQFKGHQVRKQAQLSKNATAAGAADTLDTAALAAMNETTSGEQYVECLYDYEGKQESGFQAIRLAKGDVVALVATRNDGWSHVKTPAGTEGWAPGSYLKEVVASPGSYLKEVVASPTTRDVAPRPASFHEEDTPIGRSSTKKRASLFEPDTSEPNPDTPVVRPMKRNLDLVRTDSTNSQKGRKSSSPKRSSSRTTTSSPMQGAPMSRDEQLLGRVRDMAPWPFSPFL